MAERTGFMEVLEYNNVVFNDSQFEDLVIYTETSAQNILLGTIQSNLSTLALRSNVATFNARVGISKSNPQVAFEVNSTDAILIPQGTTAQRPTAPSQGLIRYNTQLNTFEGYGAGNAWGSLGGVKDTNQDTYISAESYPTSNDDNLTFVNSNIERMRLTKEGKLGIGTSNPFSSLHIEGDAFIRDQVFVNSNIKLSGHIIPNSNETYDLGTSNNRFKDIYLSGNTIFLGDAKIKKNPHRNGIMIMDADDSINSTTTSMIMLSNYGELAILTSNNFLGIRTSNPTSTLEVHGTDAMLIPKGTTAERPLITKQGQIRYNTDINTFEGYGAGNAWGSLGGVKDTNQDTFISAESYPTSNDDNIVFFNSNIETIRVLKNGYVGFSNSNPSERLDISNGNAKFNSNLYVINQLSVGKSNPTESIDIEGNAKISTSLYVFSNIGIGLSNPTQSLDVNGSAKIRSNLEIFGNLTVSGTTIVVDSTTVNIADNILNINNGASYNSSLQAGIGINRGTGYSNYYFIFDEQSLRFKIGEESNLYTVASKLDNSTPYAIPYYDDVTDSYTHCNTFAFSNGMLAIGKTNPQYPLDVAGSINAGALLINGAPLSADTGGGFTAANSYSYTMCNVAIGKSNPTNYKLDVNGDINFTGRILQNGFEYISGPISSNNIVTSFQVAPVMSTTAITTQNSNQSVFNLTTQGTLLSDPTHVQVMLNGTKLAYINENNKDFTLSISNPTPYTTQFTVTLVSPADYGDIVDIIVWPYYENLSGVYLTGIDFASNITFSNVGIGVSNPSYPFHAINSGNSFSNWLMGLENGKVKTYLSHSDGMGIKIIGSNVTSTNPVIECINGSNMLLYLTNDGRLGLGKSNINLSYSLDVNGIVNAKGLLINDAPLDVNIGGGFTSSNTTQTFTFCNVGIGKSNPSYPLDVVGNINATGLLINGEPLSTSIGGGFTASNNKTFTMCNVGIGMSNPLYTLDVFGTLNTSNLLINGEPPNKDIGGGFTASNTYSYTFCNVGIGKSNPSYALDIQGTINATELLLNGVVPSKDIGGGFISLSNDFSYSLCNIGIGTSNKDDSYILNVAGRSKISDGIVISSSNTLPYISMIKDPFTSGIWSGLGQWGMFQHSNTILLSTNHQESNYINFVAHESNSTIVKNAVSIDTYNKRFGVGKTPGYELDVNGDINFSGRILQNGFEYVIGPITSNNYVSAFQVKPISQIYSIDTQSAETDTFTLTYAGNYLADPQSTHVLLNGTKLAYINSSNYDFTLTVTNPTLYTTQFTVVLNTPAVYGDVVDITVWPYLPNTNGVFLSSIDFASNIMFSNIGLGLSNPSYPLHAYNNGSSNWLVGLENGPMKTLLCHSRGSGLRIEGSNASLPEASFECINGSNMLLYLRNDGLMGIGTSNLSQSYTLQVEGAINATGSVTSSSDERLKTNIKKLTNSLDSITKLNGYSFQFKNDMDKKHIGLLAQEVEQILPEVVYKDNDGYMSVAYGNIVAVLVECIKDQQKQINELQKRFDYILTR